MIQRLSLAVPVLATLWWSAASSNLNQDPPKQDPIRVTAQQTGFVLKEGEIAIQDLVAKAESFLGVTIMIEPNALAQNPAAPITIAKALELDVNGCWDVLSQLLQTRGFALVPLNREVGLWEVLSMNGQRRQEIAMRAVYVPLADLPKYQNRAINIRTTVPLEYANGQIAPNALRPFFASSFGSGSVLQLTVGNTGQQSSVLLAGMGPDVHEAWKLIQQIDAPPAQPRQLHERLEQIETRLDALEKAR